MKKKKEKKKKSNKQRTKDNHITMVISVVDVQGAKENN